MIRCRCGESINVPPLREIQANTPERLLVEVFNDETFWDEQGCYLCGVPIKRKVFANIQLAGPVYGTLPGEVHPLSVIGSMLFGGIFAIWRSRETVVVKDAIVLKLPFRLCYPCAHDDHTIDDCMSKLTSDRLGKDLLARYPGLRYERAGP